MIYIVFVTESVIGHVFHELEDLLGYMKSKKRHHRIEVWNKGKLSGLHII